MGSATTFYDIVEGAEEEELVAATSRGILYSTNYGNDWTESINLPSAPRRIFKSSSACSITSSG